MQAQQTPYLESLFQSSASLHVLELGTHKRGAFARLDVEEFGHSPHRPVHLHGHTWPQLVARQHVHAKRSGTRFNCCLTRQQASRGGRSACPPRAAPSADRRYGTGTAGARTHCMNGNRDESAPHGDEKGRHNSKTTNQAIHKGTAGGAQRWPDRHPTQCGAMR